MNVDPILPAGQPSSSPVPSQPGTPLRVLVAEDDPTIRELNAELLRRSGYEVAAVGDGAAAWQELNTNNYELLITDNQMPKVTGVELLKKLWTARMNLPTIMATSAVPEKAFAREPWLLPSATLLKPYTAAEMLRTVKRVLCEACHTPTATPQARPSVGNLRIE